MSHQIRADYDQLLMFPPSVEEWIGPDHPARFIRDFVDSLDLESLGFSVPSSEVGRPGYAPDLCLKVWIYGYWNRIRSTRKLEKACREHMGLIWLTGMHAPDHNSLWRFLDSSKKALSGLFKKSVHVAVKCKMVGMVAHALDGTKIKANSSRERMASAEGLERMQEKLDRSVADFMTEIERCEQEEMGEYRLPQGMHSALRRKDKIRKALVELESTQQEKVHHCEPESRFMKNRRTIELSYNAQAVADKCSGIIVAQDVVTEPTDNGQLVPMLDQVKENLGAVAQETVADSGYYCGSQIGLAEERQYEVLVNAPSAESSADRRGEDSPYPTSWFTYDEQKDCCICPHGRELPYMRTRVRGSNQNGFRVYRCREYSTCPYRSQCSKNKKGRCIEISVHHKAIERQRTKRKDPEKKKLLSQRKTIIEPIFAWIKRHLGFDRWTVYGLERVKAQWDMVCTVINMQKLYKRWRNGGLDLRTV